MNSLSTLIKSTAYGVTMTVLPFFFIIAPISNSLALPVFITAVIIAAVSSGFKMYQSYAVTKKGVTGLLFAPTGDQYTLFNELITQTGIDPKNVRIRYAWSNNMIAITQLDTISLDPYFWPLISQDPEAQKCHTVLQTHIEPTLTPGMLTRMADCKAIFSTEAQKFIFKHELGHIKNNTSIKRLVATGIVLTLISALSWMVGAYFTQYGLLAAVASVLITGIFLDLVLSFGILNRYKYYDESYADTFACTWSSPEEIEAAGQFFKKFDEIVKTHDERVGIIRHIPISFFSGHPSNKERSEKLLRYTQNK